MLLRKDNQRLILIPQPAHAWLAGQMARAWGNAEFGPPDPFEEVCAGVEQHDIGWQDRDQHPGFLAETGMPMQFPDVPAAEHTLFWADGVRRAASLGRYPALLVSLHGTTIYSEKFDMGKAAPADAAAARRFLDEQHSFQSAILASLRADPRTAASATPEAVERNRLLVAALDAVSLYACWGLEREVVIGKVPTHGPATRPLVLRPTSPGEIAVDPWPFGPKRLVLAVEGRRLSPPFRSEEALLAAYAAAQPMVVEILLHAPS
ncbi:MAG TPA: DUF3891 family protein [Lichenihabitans sp.]|jgi:hypothetical protein|nr:DUF3891 family protein [Lichenihabitans sp.]